MAQPLAKRRFSNGALILAQHGIRQQTIADALGVTKQFISLQLAGERSLSPSLVPVVRALAGDDAAAELEAALTDRRSA
jgi:transcriptional regulator with XRE-family HTH domain